VCWIVESSDRRVDVLMIISAFVRSWSTRKFSVVVSQIEDFLNLDIYDIIFIYLQLGRGDRGRERGDHNDHGESMMGDDGVNERRKVGLFNNWHRFI
jgi:hypothetical protein